jgi:hypothetical protein
MSLTIAYDGDKSFNEKCGQDWKMFTGTIAFDASYPTGGEAWDMSALMPVSLKAVFIENKSGYVFEYDYTNKKVIAYYCDYSTGTDAVMIEVANTVDLSAVTGVRFMAIGE